MSNETLSYISPEDCQQVRNTLRTIASNRGVDQASVGVAIAHTERQGLASNPIGSLSEEDLDKVYAKVGEPLLPLTLQGVERTITVFNRLSGTDTEIQPGPIINALGSARRKLEKTDTSVEVSSPSPVDQQPIGVSPATGRSRTSRIVNSVRNAPYGYTLGSLVAADIGLTAASVAVQNPDLFVAAFVGTFAIGIPTGIIKVLSDAEKHFNNQNNR